MNETSERLRSGRFRSAIAGFIEARREAKLKGKEEEGDISAKYDYGAWLADAARRVGQIQAVTHVLKATHPDARGSSLHVRPDALPRHAEIGTHVLGDDFAEDVVGNAAALDVFKFLKIEVEGRRLLDWMQAGDADLRSALHADAKTADSWMKAFSGLVRGDTHPASHEAAKQLYWLVDGPATEDAAYHLLQPLFSSSLAHAVHAEIQNARFGEDNKAARQAFRAKEAHETPYRDYRNLVARKLGGTKPQNVSQLNSERGGVNYLLASLPPSWDIEQPRKLLNLESAMDRLAWFPGVRDTVDQLASFLLSNPSPTDATRRKRSELAQELGAQLAIFAVETQVRFEPGWTRNESCTLPLHQQVWLDPERVELDPRPQPELAAEDEAFIAAWEFGDWPDQVAGDFANWLNDRLRSAGLVAVGDAEYRHWARHAVVDATWPVPVQRRAPKGGTA
ncbi:type I-F CRISPR-associated protein Csy1 [Stenotrophomonas nitritireducens]|uniref:type I-F CRISPR-associated protein Csy1 n=1 Tax=Stenotrophomonas nitritireducens TaxID=83617 RepID=UPI003D95E0FF